jgi:hypothetical protein
MPTVHNIQATFARPQTDNDVEMNKVAVPVEVGVATETHVRMDDGSKYSFSREDSITKGHLDGA